MRREASGNRLIFEARNLEVQNAKHTMPAAAGIFVGARLLPGSALAEPRHPYVPEVPDCAARMAAMGSSITLAVPPGHSNVLPTLFASRRT